MKLTLNWLKRHIELKEIAITNEEIEQHLGTLVNISNLDREFAKKTLYIEKIKHQIEKCILKFGGEIESFKLINASFKVKVLEVKKVEGLKVKICKINISHIKHLINHNYESEIVQVFTAAENIKEGMITAFSPIGSVVNFRGEKKEIEERDIKGYKSFGLFNSSEEIGLEIEHEEGLLEFETGEGDIVKFDDILIDISSPANQWQLKNVRGIARQLAFSGLGNLKPLPIVNSKKEFDIKVSNTTNTLATFCSIENASVKQEVSHFLSLIGKGSKNDFQALNDFVLLDIGHPIHVYDKRNLKEIHLSTANKGQKYQTFNGELITKGREVIISNEQEPIVIGGIIGIKGFEKDTKDIVIDGIFYNREQITYLTTESSKMFNLGVDANQAVLMYVCSLVDGEASKVFQTQGSYNSVNRIILPHYMIYKMCGVSFSIEQIKEMLEKYSYKVSATRIKREINDEFSIEVLTPSWRTDIRTPQDLIEEIIRLDDFQSIITHDQKFSLQEIKLQKFTIEERVRLMLIDAGFTEIMTLPFISEESEVKIINPINSQKPYMRNTLAYSLMEAANETISQGEWGVKLFEIGKVYPSETQKLGIIVYGKEKKTFNLQENKTDFFHLKQIIENLANILDIKYSENSVKIETSEYYNQSMKLNCGEIGTLKYNPKYQMIQNAYYCEIEIKAKKEENNLQETNKFNYRNISANCSSEVTWNEIAKEFNKEFNGDLIKFWLFDYYKKEDAINIGITLKVHESLNIEEIHLSASKILQKFSK